MGWRHPDIRDDDVRLVVGHRLDQRRPISHGRHNLVALLDEQPHQALA